ncbi:hypothetical protein MMC19_000121 [Ptychographa xylographoides]|nr:hypothetical protein [Ptychographa xylographoides]
MADCRIDATSATYNDTLHPSKRRRIYRKRVNEEVDLNDNSSAPQEFSLPTAPLTLDELVITKGALSEEQPDLSVAEILRQRKATQRRRVGIEFSNTTTASKNTSIDPQLPQSLISNEDTIADMEAVINRFTPQTGQVVDVDNKHMMAYIDAELAKRRRASSLTSSSHNANGIDGSAGPGTMDSGIQRQPAALGKLHEIDLGPDATARNIARTEAAKRRLAGQEEMEEGTGKIRLRRDGKPWRGRRRRNSEDVKRDRLVEEVLRESRCVFLATAATPTTGVPTNFANGVSIVEIYDEPEDEAANDDQAADDRIAEQFRREFLDAISSRRQRTGPSTTTKPGKGAVDDKPKGPKLGGSRSARAAMRELQEKAEKKK